MTLGATISGVLVIIYPFILMRLNSKINLSIKESSPFFLYPILIGFLLIAANVGGYLSARTYSRLVNAPIIKASDIPSQSIKNAFYHTATFKKVIRFETSKVSKKINKNEGHANYNYVCHRIVPMVDSTTSNININSLVTTASIKLWLTSQGSSLSPGCHIEGKENTGYVITIDNEENAKIFSALVNDIYQGVPPKVTPVFVKNSLKPQAERKKYLQLFLLVPIVANIVSLLILLMLFLVYRKNSS